MELRNESGGSGGVESLNGLTGDVILAAGANITLTPVGNTITIASIGGSANLEVGSSTITSGTTTRILYDNAGILGEYTITGTGTVVAMATSPVFTTPNIGSATGSISGNAGTVTVADAGGDTTTFPLLGTDATGSLSPRTDAGLTYNATTNALTTTTFVGALTGNADTATNVAVGGITGLGTNVATALAVNVGSAGAFITFNGDAGTPSALVGTNITGTGAGFTAGVATLANTVASANEATDTTCFPLFITASGTQTLATKNNTALTFNSNTGALGATSFVGAGTSLTGIPYTLTGTANQVTLSAGTGNITFTLPNDLRITSASVGTNADSIPTLSSTSALTNKTYNGNTFTAGTGILTIAASKTLTVSNTIALTGTDGVSMNVSNNKIAGLVAPFDGGGSAVVNGSTFYVSCPYAGTITAYTILVDTGTCTIKTWKKAIGTAIPTVSDSISTSGVSISSGTAIRSTTVSDFTTTTVAANDILAFNITAISGATKITFLLEITKT